MEQQNSGNGGEIELPLDDNGRAAPARGPGAGGAAATSRPRRGGWVLSILGRILPMLLAFLLGGIVGLYFQPPGLQIFFRVTGLTPGGGTDTPIATAIDTVRGQTELSVVSEGDVVALGRVIPRDDIVMLALPYGAGDARIAELKASTGDNVKSGDVVAVLDNLASLKSAVASAQVAVDVKEAALQQARATVSASRDEARAELARLAAAEQEAKSALERTQYLFERGIVSDSSLDSDRTRAESTARDVERARATLSRYLDTEGGQADISLAQANLRAARADLSRAENDLDRAYVRSPIDGTVLDVNVRVGERPGEQGIANLGNTEVMTVEAEVYQTLIGRVAIGDPVTVIADAFDEDLAGTVTAIGLEIGRQTITSDDPAANTDARVVDVIVTLDEASTGIARRYTNLEVVVRIDSGRRQ